MMAEQNVQPSFFCDYPDLERIFDRIRSIIKFYIGDHIAFPTARVCTVEAFVPIKRHIILRKHGNDGTPDLDICVFGEGSQGLQLLICHSAVGRMIGFQHAIFSVKTCKIDLIRKGGRGTIRVQACVAHAVIICHTAKICLRTVCHRDR